MNFTAATADIAQQLIEDYKISVNFTQLTMGE